VSEEKVVLATQRPGPDDSQTGIDCRPTQAQEAENGRLAAFQPLRHSLERVAQKGKGGARAIQAAAPSSQGGRSRNAIGVFEGRSSVFPGTAFYEAPTQRFTARHQTVLGIGQREGWEEANGHATVLALTAAVADTVVTAVMRLFGSPAEALHRIVLTRRTARKDLTRTGRPIKAALAIIPRTWDKRNRSCFTGSLAERIFPGCTAQKESSFLCANLRLNENELALIGFDGQELVGLAG
jgi:hypothetical protein